MKQTSGQNPNRLKLNQRLPNKRRMITVGLNADSEVQRYSRYYDSGSPRRENAGVAVLVDTRDLSTNLKTLKQVMALPFVDALKLHGQQLWFTQHRQYVVISGSPATTAHPTEMAKMMGGIGCIDANGNRKVWSYKLLSSRCYSWEKVTSNCQSCAHETKFACLRAQFLPNEPCPPETKEEAKITLDSYPNDQIMEVLKQMLPKTFDLVHPQYTTSRAFTRFLREINNIEFDFVEEKRQQKQNQARRAAATRRCLERCRTECYFFRQCDKTYGEMHSAPQRCQGVLKPYWNAVHNGPFLASEVKAAQEEVLRALTPEQRKIVEFFAQNGGAETHIFGYRLRLGKMDPTLQFVEWYEPYGCRTMRLSVEDSMRLLHTPYPRRKRYIYPKICPGSQLDDEFLFLYIELCQNNSYRVRKANQYLRMSWYDYLRPVELEQRVGSFLATDHRMYDIGFFSNYGEVFARISDPALPSLLLNYLNRTRPMALEETAE